eukprot:4797537-Prymnesium_polylepis.1
MDGAPSTATGRGLNVVEPNCSGCLPWQHVSTTVDNAVEGHLLAIPHAARYRRNCTRSTSAVTGRNGQW